jgi:hypothetical protein
MPWITICGIQREEAVSIKPNALHFIVKEQEIEDPDTGLQLQFVHKPGTDHPYRMKVKGGLQREREGLDIEFLFDAQGQRVRS